MNKEQIAKLHSEAQREMLGGAKAKNMDLQDIIALCKTAEHSLSAQDEVLTKIPRFNIDVDAGGDDIQEVPYPTGDFCRFEDVQELLAAAAPAPIQQEPQAAQLAVTTHAKAHSTTVVIKLMQDGKATCIYSADHSANGESIGVSDLPDGIFHIAKQAVEPCGGCGETDPANRCIGCRHPFSATPPALAGSQVQAVGDEVNEREAFEAMVKERFVTSQYCFTRSPTHGYINTISSNTYGGRKQPEYASLQMLWDVWDARATIAKKAMREQP